MDLVPEQVRDLSFRDFRRLIRGAEERDKKDWMHTLTTVQAIINFGGPRGKGFHPKPLDWLYERMFGDARIDVDQIRLEIEEAKKAIAERENGNHC